MKSSRSVRRGLPARAFAWLLTLALALSFLPALPAAGAESWSQEYLDKLVSWGIMRGDQAGNLDPDRPITRAEYISIINRAYGYNEPGRTPFTDVPVSAWYADDIAIAYNAGYFTGASPTLAAPEETLSREQATVLLGRVMMLQEGLGENLDFSDGRDLSSWSRGIVKTAAAYGVVKGYPDGSFRPQNDISRGEVAILLVNAIGTPINEPGDSSLDYVYGNVTISTSGVTLRDTVIAGDLFLTGGLGLGYVTLENVTVLGRIVTSGAGEANKGDSSIILRNVKAPEMVVDSPANQFITIRAEGDTDIANTYVRTGSYLEDATGDKLGLKSITLDGEHGTGLELSGNVKEVLNLTPGSVLQVDRGTVSKLTMDEKAVGSILNISGNGDVKVLNLDTGATISGNGGVGTINVNAPGSKVSMLPDQIVIRPGLTADINGKLMDSGTGAQASEQPRLLSGYPRTADVAPTSLQSVFSTNKEGTVYWAVSSITDGSVGEADLISPPSYASKILKSGSLPVKTASTELTAKITGLTSDGSYYLSAVFVDSRDQRSPVKVVAFTTPDDSTPNFATGYPVMTKIGSNSAQVTVMATKTCKLYYALLPKGSAAPKDVDFKANAITGNLGYGTIDVTKNVTYPFYVNDKPLEEQVTYDLYLWLNDSDGAKSSTVKKLSFTTVDGTPPKYNTKPTVNSVKETAVGIYVNINEPAAFYWAVVKQGTEYPKPLAGSTVKPPLNSETAKLQVMSGMNAVKSGKVSCTKDKDATFSITGLEPQTAYDLYYIAQDKAGNYYETVEMITIHTLDNEAPTVTQKFTRYNSSDSTNPLSDTDIQLVFSEGIRDNKSNDVFIDLYAASIDPDKSEEERKQARSKLDELLRADIQLYTYGANGLPEPVPERNAANEDQEDLNWVIDYRYATVSQTDGKVTITFPTNTKDKTKSALSLRSGGVYYIQIDNIADTSDAKNIMPVTMLPEFTTVFAQVNLAATSVDSLSYTDAGAEKTVPVDMSFQLLPVSTDNVEESVYWDMLIWSDTSVNFELYRREKKSDGTGAGPWEPLGESQVIIATGGESPVGVSLTRHFLQIKDHLSAPPFAPLKTLSEGMAYEYGISFTEIDGLAERESWTQRVTVNVSIAAGGNRGLSNLSGQIVPSTWEDAQANEGIVSIGIKNNFSMNKLFQDQSAPGFIQGHPIFKTGDTVADITVMLNRPGTIYYVVSQVVDGSAVIPPLQKDTGREVDWGLVPKAATPADGGSDTEPQQVLLSSPTVLDITSPKYGSVGVVTGHADYNAGAETIHITGLEANQRYHVYFVLKGASQYSEVKYYGFETGDVIPPQITLRNSSPSVEFKTSQEAVLDYILFTDTNIPSFLKTEKLGNGPKPDYTLLKALTETDTTSGDKAGYSMFDNYASEDQKDRLQAIIRAASTSSLAATWGTLQMPVERVQSKDFSSVMSSTATYTCLAVSHHVQGTTDTFKAVTGIRNLDNTPPDIKEEPQTSITKYPPDWDPANPTVGLFSGTISITFSEEIYILTGKIDEETGLNEVMPVIASYSPDPTKEKGILEVLGGTVTGLTLARPSSSTPTRTIALNFKDVSHGQTIVFYANGNIADANGNDSGKQLTLTFNATYKDNVMGLIVPRFEYSWR